MNFCIFLDPVIPPRAPLDQDYNYQPPRPPPRSLSTSILLIIKFVKKNIFLFLESPYYNSEPTTPSPTNGSQNPYTAFQTLV